MTKILPAPDVEACEWVAEMSVRPDGISLRDYREFSGDKKRLWMTEGARQIVRAMKHHFMKSDLITVNGEPVNHFIFTDEAREFWKMGREQGLTNQEMLDGWIALQSITADVK